MFFIRVHRYRLISRKTAEFVSLVVVVAIMVASNKGWINLPSTSSPNANGQYKVTRFIDGDTIAVDMDGKDETVRMIGIDTPETHKPDTPVQCYGPAAAAYVKNLIGNTKVRLEADPQNQNRDRYNRLLRYVYLDDGRLVEKVLISNGYGFAYTRFPFTKKAEFVAAENDAKNKSVGLWSNCEVTDNDGLKQTNSLMPAVSL